MWPHKDGHLFYTAVDSLCFFYANDKSLFYELETVWPRRDGRLSGVYIFSRLVIKIYFVGSRGELNDSVTSQKWSCLLYSSRQSFF